MDRLSKEEKLANRVLARHKLTPPIDVDALISQYAKIEYRDIPIEGIDGVSLDIKIPNKTPLVIVNSRIARVRQAFTIAHELGHIIIPWHIGTVIADVIDWTGGWMDYEYREMEQEANRFAAALLMPSQWIREIRASTTTISNLHHRVQQHARVSPLAAAIRLISCLETNILYVIEEAGHVTGTGRTFGTEQVLPADGSKFLTTLFKKIEEHSSWTVGRQTYHWFKLPAAIHLVAVSSNRSWREILNDITRSIQPSEGSEKFKSSVNAIIANANGTAKRKKDYSIDTLCAICYQRLSREGLQKFVDHPDFNEFLYKKAEELVNK